MSQLRQPSKITSPGGLSEISASDQNARFKSNMPPPGASVIPLKRKTLAEQAGDFSRPAQPPSSSRAIGPGFRVTSIANARREPSHSSSVSSRQVSGSSNRSASNSSFSSSVSTGSRPVSSQYHRPQSVMARSRIQQRTPTPSRPSTSLDVHPGTGLDGNMKGRTQISSSLKYSAKNVIPPRIRGSYDTLLRENSTRVSGCPPGKSLRDISISTAFNGLAIESAPQATPKVVVDATFTPSHIPKRIPGAIVISEAPSPSKSPQKPPKPLPQFLNRFSNIPIAWDMEGRVQNMEQIMSDVSNKLAGETVARKALEDTAAVYKSRSMLEIDHGQCTTLMKSHT